MYTFKIYFYSLTKVLLNMSFPTLTAFLGYFFQPLNIGVCQSHFPPNDIHESTLRKWPYQCLA